jgi:methylated-DNA-protein-cysteine methyltransferase-like protein
MTGEEDEPRIARIRAAVAAIPRGRVDSYGGVAHRAGFPGRARLVGHALRTAPADLDLPWHRVVNASGRISFPPGSRQHARQRRLLAAEGVHFGKDGRVDPAARGVDQDLDRLLWGPPDGGR